MPKQTTNLNSQNSVHFSSRENFLSKEFLANILLPCGCGIGMKCLTLDSQQCFHDSVEVEVGWRAAAAHGTVAWQKQERQHLVRFSASWWAIVGGDDGCHAAVRRPPSVVLHARTHAPPKGVYSSTCMFMHMSFAKFKFLHITPQPPSPGSFYPVFGDPNAQHYTFSKRHISIVPNSIVLCVYYMPSSPLPRLPPPRRLLFVYCDSGEGGEGERQANHQSVGQWHLPCSGPG